MTSYQHIKPPSEGQKITVNADMSLNVLDVAHHRSGTRLPVNSVEILVVVETRDDDHRREVLQAFRSSGYDVDIVE